MIYGFLVINALIIGVLYWGRGEVRSFVSSVQRISTLADLEVFKRMVKRQMTAGIVVLPLGVASFAMVIALNVYYGLLGAAIVMAVCIPIFFISQGSKSLELQSRSLPCIDALREEYIAVSTAWLKKLLPNF